MRMWTTCWLSIIVSIALAGESREEVHAGVKVTFQSAAEVNPAGIIEVATVFLDAMNQQKIDTMVSCVHEQQKEMWRSQLAKQQKKRDLSLDHILIFKGNYKMEGKKMRDQFMARVHAKGAGDKGGMSFLMLLADNKWVFVID
ncbi:MAG: hypothetical protein WC299_03290 [Kiritimatiellia bacterium]